MVPMDQPEVALAMMNQFVSDTLRGEEYALEEVLA
jgi:hypothetical protein